MDFPELVAEVSDRSGIPGLAMRAETLTRMAEAELNKRLTVGAQERNVTLTTGADKTVALPRDYVVMRRVSMGGKELRQWSLGDILSEARTGFAIRSGRLVTSFAEKDIDIAYYQGLTPLSLEFGDWLADDWDPSDWLTDASTNWLLEQDPEIYVFALMKQWLMHNAAKARGPDAAEYRQKAVDADAYLDLLVNNRNGLDIRARFSGTRFRTSGPTP